MAVAIALRLIVMGPSTTTTAPAVPRPAAAPVQLPRTVFISRDLAPGGGGGGGSRQPGPIRQAEGPGHDRATLRVTREQPASSSAARAETLPAVVLEAKPLASGNVDQIGLPAGGVPFGTSTGPGSGGGVGEGAGTGIGPGRDPGVGPGSGGGTGGGVHRAGGAVSAPTLLVQVRPSYTDEALAQKIQGAVVIDVVVTSGGLPSRMRIVRSLDPGGLDLQALDAVSRWRFAPGRLHGAPVDVLVTVVLDFSIR